jgi:hypothetical protein
MSVVQSVHVLVEQYFMSNSTIAVDNAWQYWIPPPAFTIFRSYTLLAFRTSPIGMVLLIAHFSLPHLPHVEAVARSLALLKAT